MMENGKYILIFILILFFTRCNKINKDCEINSIKIESKRSYKNNIILEITDKKIISKIIALKEKSVPIYKNNVVKSNLGYIQLYHYCDGSKVNVLHVIYTKYNGVIIRSGPDKYYLNHKLKNYIEELLENK